MIVAVTGGAGFIGQHLVRGLLSAGIDCVRVFDNQSHGTFGILERMSGAECIKADIRDLPRVRAAMAGCEIVFHLAATATVMGCESHPFQAHDVNVTGTLNLIRAATDGGVRRLVMASSREVYGDSAIMPVPESTPMNPKNVYGATKAAAEVYCGWASSSLEVTILRLANVFGPGDTDRVIPRFIYAARRDQPLRIYGGGQILDFIWIDRVVEAFMKAGLGSLVSGPVNIGSGTGTTVLDAAQRVIAASGSASTVNIMPTREVEVSRFVADVTRMSSELGVKTPRQPLEHLHTICCDATVDYHGTRRVTTPVYG